MPTLKKLLERNRLWAAETTEKDPEFFARLSKVQHPEYLWIGCSDSRVPANQIMNLLPGEVFVHRNIANLVKDEDENCMSVLEYAINVLEVKHIIVAGHYGCGGIKAGMSSENTQGLLGNWLYAIKKTHSRFLDELRPLSEKEAFDRMCELNVLEQTERLARNRIIQAAWARGLAFEIHSWIYCMTDGLIKPLRDVIRCPEDI